MDEWNVTTHATRTLHNTSPIHFIARKVLLRRLFDDREVLIIVIDTCGRSTRLSAKRRNATVVPPTGGGSAPIITMFTFARCTYRYLANSVISPLDGHHFCATISISNPWFFRCFLITFRGQMFFAICNNIPSCRCPTAPISRSPNDNCVSILVDAKRLNIFFASSIEKAFVPGLFKYSL